MDFYTKSPPLRQSFEDFIDDDGSHSTYQRTLNTKPVPLYPHGRFGLGHDVEAILSGVIGFMIGGIILVVGCFIVTKCYILYKMRLYRERRTRDSKNDEYNLME